MALADLMGLGARSGEQAQQQPVDEQQQLQEQQIATPQEIQMQNEIENAYRVQSMRQGGDMGSHQFTEKFLNRMISVHLPKLEERQGLWFLDHAEFIEVLTLLNLDSNAHRQLHRDYLELEDLATGSSNRLLVESKQRELLFDLLCYKSRSDFGDEKSLRERSMWMTTRNQSTSDIRMPVDNPQRGGFLSSIFGRRR